MNAGTPAPFGWKRSARAGLTFRPVTDDDLLFLTQVYASTRCEDSAATSMNPAQRAALVLLEFRAQDAHFQKHYPQADRLVITGRGSGGKLYDIGRLYLARWPAEHGIIDIALLPRYRRHGAGEVLLRDLMDEAAAAGKTVSILVQKLNPAIRLYRRLGFVAAEDKGSCDLMRWRPAHVIALPPGPR
jgi:ribosomal protein S18 acetylase RimI-like enzyme